MRNSYLIVMVIITVFSSAQTKADPVLPANFDLPGDLESVMARVYEQSETFRAQCDRLAQARNLHVAVRFDFNMRSSCRAFTIIRRTRGVLCADVHVPAPSSQIAELIAHEFEHILEQVEHLDLRRLARDRTSGVREVEADLFETDRAQRAGRVVADEMRGRRATRPSAD
jgi:hypothetical protein